MFFSVTFSLKWKGKSSYIYVHNISFFACFEIIIKKTTSIGNKNHYNITLFDAKNQKIWRLLFGSWVTLLPQVSQHIIWRPFSITTLEAITSDSKPKILKSVGVTYTHHDELSFWHLTLKKAGKTVFDGIKFPTEGTSPFFAYVIKIWWRIYP